MPSLYDRILVAIFERHHGAEVDRFQFERQEMEEILQEWGETIKNLGDVIYTYRGGRRDLPEAIARTGHWTIEGRGRGIYEFVKIGRNPYIQVPVDLAAIDLLDATPEIIAKYSRSDEQGLLAKIRYNRLIDTFLGITAYHLQGHIRAFVAGKTQVEVDDLYLAVDKEGNRYVIPVEAKTADEPLGVVQIAMQNVFGRESYPDLEMRSIAAKVWQDGTIFLMEFNATTNPEHVEVKEFKRYRLIKDNPV